MELRLANLSGSNARPVAKTGSQAIYAKRAGADRLLFVRDDTLFEQDFDLGSAMLSGSAIPIQEKINRSSVRFGKYDFSAARSGVLSYRRREANFGLSELAWYDRNGRRLSQAAPPDRYYYMSLSPNGETVAATLSDESGNVDVWTIDLERGVRQRRTRHPGYDRTPIWSPDGATILFNSERAEVQSDSKMYVISRDGGAVGHFPVIPPASRKADVQAIGNAGESSSHGIGTSIG